PRGPRRTRRGSQRERSAAAGRASQPGRSSYGGRRALRSWRLGLSIGSIGTPPNGSRNRPAWTLAVGADRFRESDASSGGGDDRAFLFELFDLCARVAERGQHLARVLAEERRGAPDRGRRIGEFHRGAERL